jgi:translation initiation factor 1
MKNKGLGGLVYSTEHGNMCPVCRQPQMQCVCKNEAPKGDGVVRIRREVRRGKEVTAISGVPLPAAELAAFAKGLRTACGAGGTVKDGVIEIQGNHLDTVQPLLAAQGWTVKRAGG